MISTDLKWKRYATHIITHSPRVYVSVQVTLVIYVGIFGWCTQCFISYLCIVLMADLFLKTLINDILKTSY